VSESIFERYGGFAFVRKVVSEFYDRVLDDVSLSPFFANTDMRRQIDHQTQFIASLIGGPASLSDEGLRRVHQNLGIRDADFDTMMGVLAETLEDFGFSGEDVRQVMGEMNRRRHLVVTRA